MKIAILSTLMFDNSIGGVENHIRFMCKEMILQGHEIMLFKPVWSDKYNTEPRRIHRIPITLINAGNRIYNLNQWSGEGIVGLLAAFFEKSQYTLGNKKVVQIIS